MGLLCHEEQSSHSVSSRFLRSDRVLDDESKDGRFGSLDSYPDAACDWAAAHDGSRLGVAALGCAFPLKRHPSTCACLQLPLLQLFNLNLNPSITRPADLIHLISSDTICTSPAHLSAQNGPLNPHELSATLKYPSSCAVGNYCTSTGFRWRFPFRSEFLLLQVL
jgi:hypothetical protein